MYFVCGTEKGVSTVVAGGKLMYFNSLGVKQGEYDIPAKYGNPASSIQFAADGECWIAIPNTQIDRVQLSDMSVLETRTIKVTEGFWVMANGSVWASKNENFNLYNSSDVLQFTYERINDETEGLIVDKYNSLWHNSDKYIHGGISGGNQVHKYILYPLI